MSKKTKSSAAGLADDRDLATPHEADERSLEALRKWEHLFEYAGWGIILVGPPTLSMRAVNPAYARMHGYTVEELTGRPVEDTIAPEARTKLEQIVKIVDQNGHDVFESVHIRKDGTTFPVLIDSTAVKDDGGSVLIRWVNCQDLTDGTRLSQRLCETQKVESLGVLAGGVAHDFNNLLTSIIGNAILALEKQPPDSSARANLAQIIRSGEKAADLTRQMLAYSGKGGFIIRRVNLSEEVRASAELLQAAVPKTVRLEFDLSGDISPVDADPSQIQQLIINLVVNGAEAIGEQGGMVWVKTRTAVIDENVVRGDVSVGDLQPGPYACLEVRDSCCGMDENTVTRIFDPFFTTKFTGRGLGLAAVSGIVRRYHGAVKVQSKLGEGSTFRVFLPVAEAEPGREMLFHNSELPYSPGHKFRSIHKRKRAPLLPIQNP
jgi:two-component system, cell cycle sensor histidine kinase and response regulator CckA